MSAVTPGERRLYPEREAKDDPSTDPAQQNIPFRKRAHALNAELNRWRCEEARKAAEHHREGVERRKAARLAEKERQKFTAEDLAEAIVVRDSVGWHKVIRVSAKSVTVATAWSWTDRIPLDRVIDFRAAPSPRPTEDPENGARP